MNAYELADELAECIIDGSTDLVCVAQAANMLRQQAGELEYYKVRDSSHIKIIKEQADQIAELENEVKRLVGSEPITYGRLTFCKNCGQQDPYTQTKPLSDEEMKELINNFPIIFSPQNLLSFARAIEERHGIK